MFVILLRFTGDKSRAPALMQGHKDWIEKGFADGAFLLTGSLPQGAGGAIFAKGDDMEAITARVGADPFVAEQLVTPEIIAVAPGRTLPAFEALLAA
jgi:uncharacterized protein YciI